MIAELQIARDLLPSGWADELFGATTASCRNGKAGWSEIRPSLSGTLAAGASPASRGCT
jgi:hypothetical protein